MELDTINDNISLPIIAISESEIVDLIQIGTTMTDDNELRWIKCRFKTSGVTYLFTAENYINGIHTLLSRFMSYVDEKTETALEADVIKSLNAVSETADKMLAESTTLSEADKLDVIATRSAPSKISFNFDVSTDEELLTSIFNQYYDRINVIQSCVESVPVPVLADFMAGFRQAYSADGSPLAGDIPTFFCESDDFTAILYSARDIIPATKAEVWKKGIEPICFCGVKCTNTPHETNDLDDMMTELKIDDVVISPSDDEELDDTVDVADNRSEDDSADVSSDNTSED